MWLKRDMSSVDIIESLVVHYSEQGSLKSLDVGQPVSCYFGPLPFWLVYIISFVDVGVIDCFLLCGFLGACRVLVLHPLHGFSTSCSCFSLSQWVRLVQRRYTIAFVFVREISVSFQFLSPRPLNRLLLANSDTSQYPGQRRRQSCICVVRVSPID